ncbi:MAG: hypothetical protein ACOYEO_01610 [bacterium]|jgi:hypothetical protein
MARPLTVRQMATRLRLYRLCQLVASEIEEEQEQQEDPASVQV